MSPELWIALAVIAILVLVALVAGSVMHRRRQVSLRPTPQEPAIEAPTKVDRSGGYTASSGIAFTESSGPASAGLQRPRPETAAPGAGPPGATVSGGV